MVFGPTGHRTSIGPDDGTIELEVSAAPLVAAVDPIYRAVCIDFCGAHVRRAQTSSDRG